MCIFYIYFQNFILYSQNTLNNNLIYNSLQKNENFATIPAAIVGDLYKCILWEFEKAFSTERERERVENNKKREKIARLACESFFLLLIINIPTRQSVNFRTLIDE